MNIIYFLSNNSEHFVHCYSKITDGYIKNSDILLDFQESEEMKR